jgi:hypothetical protein
MYVRRNRGSDKDKEERELWEAFDFVLANAH